MSEIFLSYSRRDSTIVKDILGLLEARKREAWIDLNDINYSVKWWDEICGGIDAADNFVLLISPNSLTSLFCHREIQYATEHNKRIIPFLITQVDHRTISKEWETNPEFINFKQLAEDNWETIQSIQWIDCTNVKQINKAVDDLLQTVDTDPERTRLHTRLLLRVRGWESGGRNPSGLLRGAELMQYEVWLSDSNNAITQPQPTKEQEDYINESRQFETEEEAKRIRRERLVRRFRGASIALALFLISAVVAIYLSIAREARTNEQVAAGQTQIAIAGKTLTPIPPALTSVARTLIAGNSMIESLNLSAEAISILRAEGGNAEIAALLGIRVLRNVYLESADEALVEATNRLKAVPVVFQYDGGVSGVDFSPDGKHFIVGISTMYEGWAELRETESGKLIWSLEPQNSIINSVSFSPDGTLIIAAMGDHTAALWDVNNGEVIHHFQCGDDFLEETIFSPDGRTILTRGGSVDGDVVRSFNIQTGEEIFKIPADGWSINYLPDGKTFQMGKTIYSSSNGSIISNYQFRGVPLDFSMEKKIYATGISPTIEIVDMNNGQQIHFLEGHTDAISMAVFSKSGNLLLTGSDDNTARLWNTNTGDQITILAGHLSNIYSIAISPDETKVLTGADGEARLWRISEESQQMSIHNSSEISAMALSPDGKNVLIGDVDGYTRLWEFSSGFLMRTFPHSNANIGSVAFSPDGKLVAMPFFSDSVIALDLYTLDTGELVNRFAVSDHIKYITFSSDGSMIFADLHDNTSRLWNISNGQLLREFDGNDGSANPPYFKLSPDGQMLAVVSWDSEQNWLNISTGENVRFPDNMWGPVIEFSNDGNLLAVHGNNEVYIWDLEKKEIIQTIGGQEASINSMAFSPNDSLLLTGSEDKTAQLWDISTGNLIRVFRGHNAAVTAVDFFPDAKRIITTGLDKTVRTWITDYHDLIAYACDRVGRDLLQEERSSYGISGQDATCPQFGGQSNPLEPTTTPMWTQTPFLSWTPIPTPTPGMH